MQFWVIILCVPFFLVACKDEEVVHYQVAKEEKQVLQPASQPSMQQMPGLAEQTERFKTPTWSAPAHWEAQALGAMRKGSFLAKHDGQQAEITVLAFPGDVGGLLANINRWAGQIQANSLSESELEQLEPMTVGGLEATFVDLVGPAQCIQGAVVMRNGDSWFFKMMGDCEAVQAEADAFRQFLSSVEFAE